MKKTSFKKYDIFIESKTLKLFYQPIWFTSVGSRMNLEGSFRIFKTIQNQIVYKLYLVHGSFIVNYVTLATNTEKEITLKQDREVLTTIANGNCVIHREHDKVFANEKAWFISIHKCEAMVANAKVNLVVVSSSTIANTKG